MAGDALSPHSIQSLQWFGTNVWLLSLGAILVCLDAESCCVTLAAASFEQNEQNTIALQVVVPALFETRPASEKKRFGLRFPGLLDRVMVVGGQPTIPSPSVYEVQ